MTPKERAKELIEKFEDVDDCDKHYNDRYSPCSHQAKQCAIICVEQILDSFDCNINYPDRILIGPSDKQTLIGGSEYWEEVLEHLKQS